MIVKVIDKGSCVGSLPDMSYDSFIESKHYKSGDSVVEYDAFLKRYNMIDLTNYNSQSTEYIELVVENPNRGRVLKFKCIYDSDNDASFNERVYFKGNHGKFDIQHKLQDLLFSFGFEYITTLGDYEHCYEKKGWKVIFNPDTQEFYLNSINSDNSQFFRPASLKLKDDDLTLDNIEINLKEYAND